MSDLIKGLANNMIARKKSETEPYILFLGAGSSISSGCSSMIQIVDEVLQSHDSKQFTDWERKIKDATLVNVEYGELKKQEIGKQKRARFFEIWKRLDRDSKYSMLREHLWENKSPSEGYINLAFLIKIGYFKMVLTSNLDNLLEKALNNAELYQPDDFIVIVNQKDKPEEVREQLESSRKPFKLVKLHGTLESPDSYAFTHEEVFDFEKTIKPNLSQIVNQSLIVIGHRMQDRDTDVLFEEEGKELHFVNPTCPELESRIDTILKVRKQGSIIEGKYGYFDDFFSKLSSYIEIESEKSSISDSTPSIEGFLKSIGYDHELEVPRSRFKNLPTLYVKPTEYKDICSKLEKEHVIFLIGEPHLGKTYTAFYLLWEYYQKGYETFHIRHDRLVTLLHKHDGKMKNVLLDLFGSEKGLPRIIHFDDPFGETTERRTDIFAKELDTFLDFIHGYEHLRVIITTRLNIFRDAMAEVHDLQKVEMLEKDIRVHTSYRRDILLDILHRYIRFYNPLWANDQKILSTIDEKLPDLLPAPHNIEFFVRTSERLSSLEDVLIHVENSKEMIKALGEWMASLPTHEQFFLIWVEVCSTASILFPETQAVKIDFEVIYLETLAFMFKKKHLAGIPVSPLSRTKDKFDMILLESREKNMIINYDFVHPSYHEAFWHTIQEKSSLYHWWEILKKNVGELFKDLENHIDLVQLNMIERYGTVNRNLDQLLLISAESYDDNEKLIALQHMLKRPEIFMNAPQFIKCIHLVFLANDSGKFNYLNMLDNFFDNLHIDVFKNVDSLLNDNNPAIRMKAEKVLINHFDSIPEAIKQQDIMKIWINLNRIFFPLEEFIVERKSDVYTKLEEKGLNELDDYNISLEDIEKFLRMDDISSSSKFIRLSAMNLKKFSYNSNILKYISK